MATVLVISSHVARGYVGGTATRVALEALGHQAWHIPTVLLSNHPAHTHCAGETVAAAQISMMVEALKQNGWIQRVDAVLTGYLPSPEHVEAAVDAISTIREAHRDLEVACDPILGDDPGGLYIDEEAARALRDRLLPHAHLVTPNRFELGWLAGADIACIDDALAAAEALFRDYGSTVLVSSVPGAGTKLVHDLIVSCEGAFQASHTRRSALPHGIGDLLTGLYVGHRLHGRDLPEAMARATAGVQSVLDHHGGSDDPPLPALREKWANAHPEKLERCARE